MRILLLFFPLMLAGCATNSERIDRVASTAGLQRTIVQGDPFQHVIYRRDAALDANVMTVYLDGDGVPWSSDGKAPAADPTTRHPLALQMLIATSGPALYVSRPCYQTLHDARCTFEAWTFRRYAPEVVASLAAAIRQTTRGQPLQLVGYSGGGTLAVLVAERLANVKRVITLAANLDIDAWVTHHRYLPLQGSLNPARSEQVHPWPEIHFAGAQDMVVPAMTQAAYFERFPTARRRTLADQTHACCWVERWPELLREAMKPDQRP